MNTIDFVIPWTTLTVDSEDIAYIDYAVNVTVHELTTRLTNTFTAWSPVWYSLATTLISDYPQWFDGSISLQDTRLSTVKVHNNYDSMPSHVDVPTIFPTIQPTDTVLNNKGTKEIGIVISKGELIAIVLSVSLFCVLPLMLAMVHFRLLYMVKMRENTEQVEITIWILKVIEKMKNMIVMKRENVLMWKVIDLKTYYQVMFYRSRPFN